MATRKIQTIADLRDKVLGVSETFLASDFAILEGNYIRMTPIIQDELMIEYTLNGTDYFTVNSAIAQVMNGSYFYRFPVSAEDTFNVRIKGGTATTVKYFKAELWLEA